MKALVTGSTGLLGNNLVRALLDAGYEVKALARSRQKAEKLLGDTAAEIIMGDMDRGAGFSSALEGVDAVFHTAAYFREYYLTTAQEAWNQLKAINIDATLDLIDAAQRHGVQAFVHTSSSGVYGKVASGEGNEQTPPDSYVIRNLYFRSKLEGDQAIAKKVPSLKMKLVTIHPVGMFGPRDAGPTGFGTAIVAALNNRLPALPPGGFAVVDARDVALAMIAAAERGTHGEHYIVSHSFQQMSTILNQVRRDVGLAPLRTMPIGVATTMARVSEAISRISGRPPFITLSAVESMQKMGAFSMAKAAAELGVSVRPFEQTLQDEVRWFIENGYIEGKASTAQRTAAAV
jgi:dihydroflavonol-4-reductase